jgi:hypothetical protein
MKPRDAEEGGQSLLTPFFSLSIRKLGPNLTRKPRLSRDCHFHVANGSATWQHGNHETDVAPGALSTRYSRWLMEMALSYAAVALRQVPWTGAFRGLALDKLGTLYPSK